MNPLQSLYYVSPACLLCLLVPFGAPSAVRAVATEACSHPQAVCLACTLPAHTPPWSSTGHSPTLLDAVGICG